MRTEDGGVEETIKFADLKQDYLDTVGGKDICKMSSNQTKVAQQLMSWRVKPEWHGGTPEEMTEWLRFGYRVPGLNLEPPIEPVRKRRRLKFGEEGELQLDLVWSGHDYPFLDWTQRDILPGMRVDIQIGSLADAKIEAQREYYRFVLRSLIALESAGIDLEIWLTSTATGVIGSTNPMTIHVQVKEEGKMQDYIGWSAAFSPGAHRHLIFLARHTVADLNGLYARGVGGSTNRGSFRIAYEHDTRTLKFFSPNKAQYFPEKEMETQLREVLLQARRAA